MGASVSIFSTSIKPKRPPEVSCVVLDSPYDKLTNFIRRIAQKEISLPSMVISLGISMIEKQIYKRTGVSISKINPENYAKQMDTPSFWMIGDKDEYIFIWRC